MRRLIVLTLLVALAVPAANVKLYLTDGTWHVVREYQVLTDRVRFFAVERGEWEEIPLTLVDLKKTKAELGALEQELAAERKIEAEEAQAERDLRREIRSVPGDPGVYLLGENANMRALTQAELKVVNNKRRSVLKAITPIPILTGKSTLEIDGASSTFVIKEERPEFYFRLGTSDRFNLVKLWKGNSKAPSRIVEKWDILPVVKEIVSERQIVEVFRKQVGDDLYKVWPMEPLAAGEYAWLHYTEGKGDTQAWDFTIQK